MIRNYIKIAWRNLINNKFSSVINIGGLAIGMAVAMLIGLWIYDELSFDKYHKNYNRIVQVMQNQTFNGEIMTGRSMPIPLGYQLRASYKSDFKYVVLVRPGDHILAAGDKKLNSSGMYMQAEGPEMLTLRMISGSRNGLQDPSSILLSATMAKSLFSDADPINKVIKIDNKLNVKVTGVYEDLPKNTTLNDVSSFIAPWDLYVTSEPFLKRAASMWGNNSWAILAQLQPNANIKTVNAHIKDLKLKGLAQNNDLVGLSFKAQVFLQPMSKWHLHQEFKNGVNTGGEIQFVWMFSLIGVFVLLLACINFMNLSTARSEKRAKEVGIRKAVGSMRGQLIIQFFAESLLLVCFAFLISIVIVQLSLPLFNQVAGKQISIPFTNLLFWFIGIIFSLITGLIAGSYPALYLSSFNPVKVLKGTFKAGRYASLPRKILVVMQFTVSVMLIIGTMIVFMEVRFSKNRPVGYNQNGLIQVELKTEGIQRNFGSVRNDLIASGAVTEVAESDSPLTDIWSNYSDIIWPNKNPNLQSDFGMISVSNEYGKTVGWKVSDGRDFSRAFVSDSSAMIINEAAAKFMGLKHPVGQVIRWGRPFKIIGVVKDMVMKSPFDPVKPTIFYSLQYFGSVLNIRINPKISIADALQKIKTIYTKYDPDSPFDYHFTDSEYAKKFEIEERIGKLAGVFTGLAIFISCLGLFGMASFAAEQRRKEIGVRKVLGASIIGLWRLMSAESVVLVAIALIIAMPTANYLMQGWLRKYTYRVQISWWLFAITGTGALLLTLLTVSYQSIKAAMANPVKSLKTE
ncbi:ABC transporter permease [Mucilaginibacter sp.]|uniref:ABC transporter permease n=1 Tax=Mucilaginibacter sp. TaxID=1882438 RepID=UPI003D0A7D09